MNAKLIIDGKEINVNISEEILSTILNEKKTGYERCKSGETYYLCTDGMSEACDFKESGDIVDDGRYERATYYSDPTVAENNARADKLMRQLRRFAVERRNKDLMDWGPISSYKWCIFYDYGEHQLCCHQDMENRMFGAVYFESKSQARDAINTFRDELIWYFTEYKDSL